MSAPPAQAVIPFEQALDSVVVMPGADLYGDEDYVQNHFHKVKSLYANLAHNRKYLNHYAATLKHLKEVGAQPSVIALINENLEDMIEKYAYSAEELRDKLYAIHDYFQAKGINLNQNFHQLEIFQEIEEYNIWKWEFGNDDEGLEEPQVTEAEYNQWLQHVQQGNQMPGLTAQRSALMESIHRQNIQWLQQQRTAALLAPDPPYVSDEDVVMFGVPPPAQDPAHASDDELNTTQTNNTEQWWDPHEEEEHEEKYERKKRKG